MLREATPVSRASTPEAPCALVLPRGRKWVEVVGESGKEVGGEVAAVAAAARDTLCGLVFVSEPWSGVPRFVWSDGKRAAPKNAIAPQVLLQSLTCRDTDSE